MKTKMIIVFLVLVGGFAILNVVRYFELKNQKSTAIQTTTTTNSPQTTATTTPLPPTPEKQTVKTEQTKLTTTVVPTTAVRTPAPTETKTPPPNPITQIIQKFTGNSCTSNPYPVFTNHLTDTSKINNIVTPPNFVSGDLKTHSYIETDHAKVPIYAPIDMTLTTGAFYVNGPYRLDFQVSCEVMLRLMHITDPIQEIKDTLPSEPANDSRDQLLKNKINFKAGDLIGYTTGTNVAGNWDFGLYNSATKNKYADSENFNWSHIYTTAVCPYDYFSPELKSIYTSKYNLRVNDGTKADGESFCK